MKIYLRSLPVSSTDFHLIRNKKQSLLIRVQSMLKGSVQFPVAMNCSSIPDQEFPHYHSPTHRARNFLLPERMEHSLKPICLKCAGCFQFPPGSCQELWQALRPKVHAHTFARVLKTLLKFYSTTLLYSMEDEQ